MLVLAASRSRPLEIILLVGYVLTAAALGKVARERRTRPVFVRPGGRRPSAPELQRVPGRDGSELEESPPASGIAVAEVGSGVVPGDLQQALLDAVIQPRAPEHDLLDPVDERLPVDDGQPFPVADEIRTERAPRLVDAPVGRELDEIRGLVDVEFVSWDQAELDGRGRHALLEVDGAERERVLEKLDDVVVTGAVIGLGHRRENSPPPAVSYPTARRIALSVLWSSIVVLAAAFAVGVPGSMTPLLLPVAVAVAGSLLALLAIRSRERAATGQSR
jgi:hypothetical protein